MPDVRMPDGTIIRNVPEGTTKAQLQARYQAANTPDDSKLRGFGLGVSKPIENMARLAARDPIMGFTDRLLGRDGSEPNFAQLADTNAARNDLSRERNARTGYQALGNFAGTLPLLALPGGWAAQGAAGGALLSDANDAAGLATDTALGVAGSGVGAGALKFAGKVASPQVRESVQALIDRKIPVTIGQALGGLAKRTEDAMTSTFGLGNLIDARRAEGVAGFNRASFDDALKPLGVTLPEGVSGHKAIKFTKEIFKQAYDAVLGSMVVPQDTGLNNSLNTLRSAATAIPGSTSKTFNSFLKAHVTPYFKNGAMAGRDFKEVDRFIRKTAKGYQNGTGAEKAYSDLLEGLRVELRAAASRGSGPDLTAALRATDDAYANYVPLRDAASKTADGSFLPSALDTSVRIADGSAGKGAKAAGEARMQALSSAAREVLPSSVGNSGTPERIGATMLLGGAGAGLGAVSAPTLALPAALALAYTKPGQKAAQWALTGRQGNVPRLIRRGMFGASRLAPAAVPPLLMAPNAQ